MASLAVDIGLTIGFVILLFATVVLDKAGNLLYRKQIAKPFYLLGYRLHHRSFLLTVVPASYIAIAALIQVHYVRLLWSSLWSGIEIVVLLSAVCLMFDLAWDGLSSKEKRTTLFHHEWVYLVVPAYIFTHLVIFI